MRTYKGFSIFIYLLMLSPLGYLAMVYSSLPERVPMHFDLHGRPDRYGNKSELFLLQAFLLVVTLGTYAAMNNLDKIDPKKAARMSKDATKKMAVAVVFLLTGISFMAIITAKEGGCNFSKILVPFLGLFFAYMGNLMYSIKPNYFVGIRTPWALEDGDNWRKTHMLAGKLWFAGGLLVCIAGFLHSSEVAVTALIVIVSLACIIPAIYSYRYFRKTAKGTA